MEFKLKYHKKSSKTIKFTTNFLGQHSLVLLISSKIHEKNRRISNNENRKAHKNNQYKLKKINGKMLGQYELILFKSFNMEFELKNYRNSRKII
jgi:hypothetical protein